MESRIAQALELRHGPVAVVLADERPSGARQFKAGKWGCVMFMLAAAAKGATAVFDRRTFGCFGGGVGLGFGNQYRNFPGGEDCFAYFLSVGNQAWERGRHIAGEVQPFLTKESYDDFVHGERYRKSPELVRAFVRELPMTEVPTTYVVFQPLADLVAAVTEPAVVIFLADMDQVAALTILANYGRADNRNVIFPYAAGCQSIGIYPLREALADKPRAVLGLNDISARLVLKRILKTDLMTFAIPLRMYREMEGHVQGSFLERPTWRALRKPGRGA